MIDLKKKITEGKFDARFQGDIIQIKYVVGVGDTGDIDVNVKIRQNNIPVITNSEKGQKIMHEIVHEVNRRVTADIAPFMAKAKYN